MVDERGVDALFEAAKLNEYMKTFSVVLKYGSMAFGSGWQTLVYLF